MVNNNKGKPGRGITEYLIKLTYVLFFSNHTKILFIRVLRFLVFYHCSPITRVTSSIHPTLILIYHSYMYLVCSDKDINTPLLPHVFWLRHWSNTLTSWVWTWTLIYHFSSCVSTWTLTYHFKIVCLDISNNLPTSLCLFGHGH